jgi:hypothetical protein
VTDEQHRRIGAILGFPPCCVEAWIASLNDPEPLANTTGSLIERERPLLEALACHVGASVVLGQPWGRLTSGAQSPSDTLKQWVPCMDCALKHGSYGGEFDVDIRTGRPYRLTANA